MKDVAQLLQSPGFIDFELSQPKRAPGSNVFSLSATSASLSPAQPAPVAVGPGADALPVSQRPDGEEAEPQQEQQLRR
jgi:hypothetical protein